mgnify:CR=1 FL=1
MFGPKQVGELIVGNAIAAENTVNAFISDASNGEIGLFSADGAAPASGKPFYFLQKTGGDASKNLDFEFSDRIDPKYINRITVRPYAPEVLGSYKVDGFAATDVVAPNRTYQVSIRVEGHLSPENFDVITGYYVTGSVLGSTNATVVRDGVLKSLNNNLKQRGNSEFEAVADGTGILITEKYQDNIPGKKDGRKLIFKVYAGVYDNTSISGYNENLELLTVSQVTAPAVGSGTGKWASEYEYFVSGYKYDPNRTFAYPLDFNTPYYTDKSGKYNVLQILYYTPRLETIQENQHKVLTVITDAGESGTDYTAMNALLAKLRTAVQNYAEVPANLAVQEGE